MSIARERGKPADQVPPQITYEPEGYKSPVVDTSKVNTDSLSTYIEGRAQICNWWSQRLGPNDEVKAFQLGLPPAAQPYRKIVGFELRITSDFTPGFSDSKEATGQLTANVYSCLRPNFGDVVELDIGNGVAGLFTVKEATRPNHYATAAHSVVLELVHAMTPVYAADLAKKTMETLYFSLDFFRKGYTPFLVEQDVKTNNDLFDHYDRLVKMYFNDFFTREASTVFVPNQPKPTYDPFLTRFLLNILRAGDHPLLNRLRTVNVQGDRAMYEFTIWSALESVDINMLTLAAEKMGLVSRDAFNRGKFFQSAYHSRAERIVYPLLRPTNVDQGYYPEKSPATSEKLVRGWARFNELDRLIPVTELISDTATGPLRIEGDGAAVPAIHRVTKDDYYVFTESFYKYEENQPKSLLEAQVLRALKNEPVDNEVVNVLCRSALRWDNLERYYYTPILLWLLIIAPRSYR